VVPSDAHADAHDNAHTDEYTNTDGDANADGICDVDVYRNVHGHADSDRDNGGVADPQSDCYSHVRCHVYVDAHAQSHGHV
jgi:hypothetical protein